jgi:hypothetical protein
VVELCFLCRDLFNHIDRGDRFVRFEQQESFNGMLFVTCVMIFYRFKRGQNVREFFWASKEIDLAVSIVC